MKTAVQFWDVIERYNQATLGYQAAIALLVALSVLAAYRWKRPVMLKLALAAANLFIGIVFFLVFDRGSVGLFFAFPLYAAIAAAFIVDAVRAKGAAMEGFDTVSTALLILVLLYPLVSLLLGHVYPRQVLTIAPCPLVALSIVLYSRYARKSLVLIVLLSLWALTGVKAFVFDVMEDLILFATGLYGVYLTVAELRARKALRQGVSS